MLDTMLRDDDVVEYILEKAPGVRHVTADQLEVRLAPHAGGKVTNVLSVGQRVTVLESRKGWSRISRYYDGSVEGEPERMVARWVSAKYLSESLQEPPTPTHSEPRTALDVAIGESDDHHQYGSQFLTAARKLIEDGRCTVADFKEMGGWMRSTTKRKTYFTYCGGMTHINNRIYLDVATGQFTFGR